MPEKTDAKPVLTLVTDKNGEQQFKHYTVESVLNVKSMKGLEACLDHYSRPVMDHMIPEPTPRCRRFYLERIRPALRWWCKVYGKPVPSWLEGNGYEFDHMEEEERQKKLGPVELDVIEFEPKSPPPQPGAKPKPAAEKKPEKKPEVKKAERGTAEREGVDEDDFSEETVDEATEHEHKEHEATKEEAKQIGLDHLAEDPDYYKKLKKIEKEE